MWDNEDKFLQAICNRVMGISILLAHTRTMSCCSCSHTTALPTKPSQGSKTNLEYLELLQKLDEIKKHAIATHKKEQWKCRFFHDWREFIDLSYDTYRYCHRCATVKAYNYYRSPTYIEGY